jgi:type F conjugative transfer system protein TrbI
MNVVAVWMFLLLVLPGKSEPIPAGTPLKARLESRVETATSDVGDPVTAVVSEPVRAAGKIVVPKGSKLVGRVETVTAATRTSEGRVRLVFRELQFPDGRTAPTWITHSFSAGIPRRNLRYVLYMAIGAGAGSIIGGDAARVAGIIGGALVGFIVAGNSWSGNLPDMVLKSGRTIDLEFREDFTVE